MASDQIVIVEDETAIRQGIAEVLRRNGYDPVETTDGAEGLMAARRPNVRLVLLDVVLPKLDGFEVLARLRKTHPTLPVILLTARGGEDDRVGGLRAGADDYVVKPFSPRELLARIEAVLRRSADRPSPVRRLMADGAAVDLERREIVAAGGDRQPLSETECAILEHLAANQQRAVSRDELLTRVWGISGGGVETRTIDMHVARLRAKLTEMTGIAGEKLIATVRGKGYMIGSALKSVTPGHSGVDAGRSKEKRR